MSLIEDFSDLLSISEQTLGSALVLLIAASALGVMGKTVSGAFHLTGSILERRKKRKRFLIDVVIFLHFIERAWAKVVSKDQIEKLIKRIDYEGDDMRGFGAATEDNSIYNEFKLYRHTFNRREIAILDAIVSQAKLFEMYYANICSESFAVLSKERKILVIKELANIHTTLMKYVTLLDTRTECGDERLVTYPYLEEISDPATEESGQLEGVGQSAS